MGSGYYVIYIEEGNSLLFSDETFDETFDVTFGKWYKFNAFAAFDFINHMSSRQYLYIYVKYKSETEESYLNMSVDSTCSGSTKPRAYYFWQAEEETELLYQPHYMRVTYSVIPEYDRINVTFEISLTEPPTDSDEVVYVSGEPGEPEQPAHEHEWIFTTINAATEEYDGLEGEVCSICGAVGRTSVIPSSYAVLENKSAQIAQAKPGSNTILEMGLFNSFSQSFMKQIAERNDVNYTIRFTYNHKNYELYIPAGTKVDTSLEWYGPDKMMQLYEWKELN